MLLSIVILTHNSKKWIEPCINALRDTITLGPVEWIVVDNASVDGSPEIVRNCLGQVELLTNPSNLGVAKARNQGIRKARGTYLLLIDDDTRALPGAIDGLCRYLDEHPSCGLVGPQLVNPDGTLQANALPLPFFKNKLRRVSAKLFGTGLTNGYHDQIESGQPFAPGYLIGACQLIRKNVLDKVGLLDEKIFYGPEDADLCLRLKQAGYHLACLPMLHVVHNYQQLSYRRKNHKLMWLHLKGLLHFWLKHRR